MRLLRWCLSDHSHLITSPKSRSLGLVSTSQVTLAMFHSKMIFLASLLAQLTERFAPLVELRRIWTDLPWRKVSWLLRTYHPLPKWTRMSLAMRVGILRIGFQDPPMTSEDSMCQATPAMWEEWSTRVPSVSPTPRWHPTCLLGSTQLELTLTPKTVSPQPSAMSSNCPTTDVSVSSISLLVLVSPQ